MKGDWPSLPLFEVPLFGRFSHQFYLYFVISRHHLGFIHCGRESYTLSKPDFSARPLMLGKWKVYAFDISNCSFYIIYAKGIIQQMVVSFGGNDIVIKLLFFFLQIRFVICNYNSFYALLRYSTWHSTFLSEWCGFLFLYSSWFYIEHCICQIFMNWFIFFFKTY